MEIKKPFQRTKGFFDNLLKRPKYYLRWALIHCALTFFFADVLAACWPAFNAIWGGVAHIGVAFAALCATFAEYIHDEDIHHGPN